MDYRDAYRQSLADPQAFWARQAEHIAWFKKPDTILEQTPQGSHRWYPDGELNSCYLALDRQIELGRGDQVALYYDSTVTDSKTARRSRQGRQAISACACRCPRAWPGASGISRSASPMPI